MTSRAPGTYLVLAPGQKAPDDVSGYIVRQSPTFNIFLGARLTDEDPTSAKQTLAQLKMYPYVRRDNSPPMDILDVGTRARSGVPPRGMEYWQRLDDVIQREPIESRDLFFHAMLRPLAWKRGSHSSRMHDRHRFSPRRHSSAKRWPRPTPRIGGSLAASIDLTRTGTSRCSSTPTIPRTPSGFEQNWIPTMRGKNWFAYFRFYRPTEPYFDRSWPLPDFEPL